MSIDGVPCDQHVWDEILLVLFESASMPPIYQARAGQADYVVANGQPGQPFELIIGLVVSSTDHWTYLGLTEGGASLVVDGRTLISADELATVKMDQILQFLPDGARVAWACELDDGWHPAIDDERGPACSSILAPHIDVDGSAYWHAIRDRRVIRLSYRD
jgi:hypothetical protein